jgi:hypothetical protein
MGISRRTISDLRKLLHSRVLGVLGMVNMVWQWFYSHAHRVRPEGHIRDWLEVSTVAMVSILEGRGLS